MRKFLLATTVALGTALSTAAMAGSLTCNGFDNATAGESSKVLEPYRAVMSKLIMEYFGRGLTPAEAERAATRLSIECVTKGRQNFETAVRSAMQAAISPHPAPVENQHEACHRIVDEAWERMRSQMSPTRTCAQSFECSDAEMHRYDACGG